MILVDTGPIVAMINDRDDRHQECKQLLERLRGPLLVPTTVATEASILLERRRGARAEQLFLEDLRIGHFTSSNRCQSICTELPIWSSSTATSHWAL